MTRGRWATIAAWGAGLALLGWALRQISWREMWGYLSGLSLSELIALVLLNLIILLTLTARWRTFVTTLSQRISFFNLFQARLAAFAVSYFTPGPQFGGEPLQVIALRAKGAPASAAAATVALDKLVELLSNFSVLALGVIALWMVGLGDARSRMWVTVASVGLILLPLVYLLLLWRNHHPFASLFHWLEARRSEGRLKRGLNFLAESEQIAGELARNRPGAMLRALVWAGVAWGLMMLEFGLSARFLGAPLSLVQTLAALAAARFAFLLPMPGGLGALSSSQVLIFTAMGFDPSAAIALVIYIRARDLLTGAVGGLMAGRIMRW